MNTSVVVPYGANLFLNIMAHNFNSCNSDLSSSGQKNDKKHIFITAITSLKNLK